MSTRTKGIGCLAIVAVVVIAVVLTLRSLRGFDASKEDPQKLYAFYVQKNAPASLKVHSASGWAAPIGGTGIRFKLSIGQKELDDLIKSKRLVKRDSLQNGLFSTQALAELKHPEYYSTDTDHTWSASGSGVRMAVDRDTGIALYMVFSP